MAELHTYTDINDLEELYRSVSQKDFAGKKKYFHLQSVYNFIFHFNKLEDDQIRRDIYHKLYNYLELISGVDDFSEIDAGTGRNLFDDYVYPIARLYDQRLGFRPFAKVDIILIWFFIFCVGLFLFSAPVYLYIIVLILFIAHYTSLLLKKKKRKVYGYFY